MLLSLLKSFLRDYGVRGQLGLESTYHKFLGNLWAVFNEVKRVLKRDGTCWVNFGDTYSGSWGNYGERKGKQRQANSPRYRRSGALPKELIPPQKSSNVLAKSLMMIPERFALGMIDRGWLLRNKIIWFKPNGMPSSVNDRFSNRWEYIYFFTKSKKYYFNLDAVRQPYVGPVNRWGGDKLTKRPSSWDKETGQETYRDRNVRPNAMGKNPGDHWKVSVASFPEAHFATFPPDLVKRPILSGCPPKGTVLDVFAGAGTTCMVAKDLCREYIGIELNPEYIKIAKKRLGQENLF